MAYSWLTFAQAKAELAIRLSEPVSSFWTDAEKGAYIVYALRVWQCMTAFWVKEYAVSIPYSASAPNWMVTNGTGSPRAQSVTDLLIYTTMQSMLLEPPSGGVWTGTNQFNIGTLAQAVQGKRDETLQLTATNIVEVVIPVVPGTNSVQLPDNALDVRRVRYVPAQGQGSPVVFERGDMESFRVFTPGYLQTVTPPVRWDVSGQPLTLVFDTLSPVPGNVEVLIMQAEPAPSPPASTPMGMPDDWTWVPMFGALADVLSAQEEAKDLQRADYCRKRYEDGVRMMAAAPWLMEARVQNVPVDTPSVTAADRFSYGWQMNTGAWPQVVIAGTDLIALSPKPNADTSMTLVLVSNAPIPVLDTDDIQVPRDVMDAILDEAEHIATFKIGGYEFASTMELHQSFMAVVERWNARVRESGIFATTLRSATPRNAVQMPRFASKE